MVCSLLQYLIELSIEKHNANASRGEMEAPLALGGGPPKRGCALVKGRNEPVQRYLFQIAPVAERGRGPMSSQHCALALTGTLDRTCNSARQ